MWYLLVLGLGRKKSSYFYPLPFNLFYLRHLYTLENHSRELGNYKMLDITGDLVVFWYPPTQCMTLFIASWKMFICSILKNIFRDKIPFTFTMLSLPIFIYSDCYIAHAYIE